MHWCFYSPLEDYVIKGVECIHRSQSVIEVSLLIGSNNNDRRAYVSIMSTVTFVLSLFVDTENLISPSVNEVLNFQERNSGTGGWVGGLLTSAHFKLVAK